MTKIIFALLLLTGTTLRGNPKIYLIRHAAVDLKKPGWGTSKKTMEYKETYNVAGIKAFDPDMVLRRIKNHESLDTVFCSPQSRALKTGEILFGQHAVLKADSVLTELDYPVIPVPVLQFPVKGWLFVSRISWMAGINPGEKNGYRERLKELNVFTDELVNFALQNDLAVVVAHGILNRELIRILKVRGWKYCRKGKEGLGNLSVNCLEKF